MTGGESLFLAWLFGFGVMYLSEFGFIASLLWPIALPIGIVGDWMEMKRH